jgi:hypothetical protein
LFQQPGEPFAKYATSLLILTRRAGGYTENEQLELLIENMDPEYRMFIRPSDVANIQELADRAAEYEELDQLRKTRTRKNDNPPASLTAVAYNRAECCWRCKQRGHTRFNCKRPPRKFCSQCGRDDTYTRDCHPLPGNENRAHGKTAADQPTSI